MKRSNTLKKKKHRRGGGQHFFLDLSMTLLSQYACNFKAHVSLYTIPCLPYYSFALMTPVGFESHVEDCITRLQLHTRLHIFLCTHHYFLHLQRQISFLQDRQTRSNKFFLLKQGKSLGMNSHISYSMYHVGPL